MVITRVSICSVIAPILAIVSTVCGASELSSDKSSSPAVNIEIYSDYKTSKEAIYGTIKIYRKLSNEVSYS